MQQTLNFAFPPISYAKFRNIIKGKEWEHKFNDTDDTTDCVETDP